MSLCTGFITLETLEEIKKDLLEALAEKERIKTSWGTSLIFYYVAWNKCCKIVFKLSVFVGGRIRRESKAANTPLALKKEIAMAGNSVLISKLISLYFKYLTSFKCLPKGLVPIAFCSLNVIVSMAMLSSAVHGLCL